MKRMNTNPRTTLMKSQMAATNTSQISNRNYKRACERKYNLPKSNKTKRRSKHRSKF